MNLVNLTPHTINIHTEQYVLNVEPSNQIARREESQTVIEPLIIDGIKISQKQISYGEVTDLPEQDEETIYIVSSLTAAGCHGRTDIRIPGPAKRDENGKIIGYDGLSVPSPSLSTEQKDLLNQLLDAYENASYLSSWSNGNLDYTAHLIKQVEAAFVLKG